MKNFSILYSYNDHLKSSNATWYILIFLCLVAIIFSVILLYFGIKFRTLRKKTEKFGRRILKAEGYPFKNLLLKLENKANVFSDLEKLYTQCEEEYSYNLKEYGTDLKETEETIKSLITERKIIQAIREYGRGITLLKQYEFKMNDLFNKMEKISNINDDFNFEIILSKNKYVELTKLYSKNFTTLSIIRNYIEEKKQLIENLFIEYENYSDVDKKEKTILICQTISREVRELSSILQKVPIILNFCNQLLKEKLSDIKKKIKTFKSLQNEVIEGWFISLQSKCDYFRKQINENIINLDVRHAETLVVNIKKDLLSFNIQLEKEEEDTKKFQEKLKSIKLNYKGLIENENKVNKMLYDLQSCLVLKPQSIIIINRSFSLFKIISKNYGILFKNNKLDTKSYNKEISQLLIDTDNQIFEEKRNLQLKKEILLITKPKSLWVSDFKKLKNNILEIKMYSHNDFINAVIKDNNINFTNIFEDLKILEAEIAKLKPKEEILINYYETINKNILLVKRAYEEKRNLGLIVEQCIVIANRYRSKNKSIEYKITQAENFFESKDYEKAYEVIYSVLYQINPKLLNTIKE